MLRKHLLIKWSDVSDGPRSPHNYYEQVLRCVGDIPLNIFATVNNRSSREKLGSQDQQRLEAEMLSDSMRNRVARLRQRKMQDRDSVIFNRAGGLLNLKLLLSVNRAAANFKPAAVGAVALHANDYIDIALPRSDAELLMVETLPVFELYNPRDIGALLRRYQVTFREIFATDARVIEVFRGEFGETPDEIRIDLVTLDDYLALLIGIFTVATKGGDELLTSIVDGQQHATLLDLSETEVRGFLAERSYSEEQFKDKVGIITGATEFGAKVVDPTWALDFSIFRERPLIALTDGRYLLPDVQFFIENAGVGVFWNIVRKFSKENRQLLLSYWGDVFEEYVQRHLENIRPPDATFHPNVVHPDFEVDAVVVDGDLAIVCEVKGGSIPQNIKVSRDMAKVTAAIDRKFVTNVNGRGKGVRQLAKSCVAVAAHEVQGLPPVKRVLPLLIVEDPALQTFGVNTYLDRRFGDSGGRSDALERLMVMTIDELELILPYVAAGDVSWAELSQRRTTPSGVVAVPAQTSFFEISVEGGFKERRDPIQTEAGERLATLMQTKYRGLLDEPSSE